MDARIEAAVTELQRRLQELYGKRLVKTVLFGSHARGKAKPGSDVDILVVLQGPVLPAVEIKRTGSIVAELSFRFDETISCIFMEEERFTNRYGPFLRNVRREGILL